MKELLAKVKSSNIAAMGHDKTTSILYLRFKSGGLYAYYPVSRATFHRFEKAKSKGTFFHEHIKTNKDHTVLKVEG